MAKKKTTTRSNPTENVTFEQGLEQLQQIVHELEEGQLGLEQSLGRYEQGIKHLKSCYALLQKAERQIELLSGVDADGNPITRPFDDSATFSDENADSRGQRRSNSGVGRALEDDDDIDEPRGLF